MTPSPFPLKADRLPIGFYDRSTAEVARDLVGMALVHRFNGVWIGGWIVETEAYLHQRDAASHSARGETRSNASMFASAGTLYVYPIHAKHCLNAVTGPRGQGSAVLIRALEPVWGIDRMRSHRKLDDLRRLTRGPAMLCQALAIDRRDDGRSLVDDPGLAIVRGDTASRRVQTTRRIGISAAAHRRLRFIDPQSRFLSRRAPPVTR